MHRRVREAVGVVGCALSVLSVSGARAADPTPPTSVGIPGDYQTTAGCAASWDPACPQTQLTPHEDGVWRGTFVVGAGHWQFKVALDGSWAVNYGLGGAAGGNNIPFDVAEAGPVRFYYDQVSHVASSDRNGVIAAVVGDFQTALGCPADWQSDCLRGWLRADSDGSYRFKTQLAPGDYQAMVALDDGAGARYGQDGVIDGSPVAVHVASALSEILFVYDAASHVLQVYVDDEPPPIAPPIVPGRTPPTTVSVPGSYGGQWDPASPATQLTYRADDDVWVGEIMTGPGIFEFKVAIDGSWAEDYGAHGVRGGPNIPFVAQGASTHFYYDDKTHFVLSDWNADGLLRPPVVAVGDFQSELGCPSDDAPDCLRSWLQDLTGSGESIFGTDAIPPGTYHLTLGTPAWPNPYGSSIPQVFTVSAPGQEVRFAYRANRGLRVDVDGLGGLGHARAQWVAPDLVALDFSSVEPGVRFELHAAPAGGLALGPGGVTGGATWGLTPVPEGLPEDLRARMPQLAGYSVFRLPPAVVAEARTILKGQLAVSRTVYGAHPSATSVQIPGVLDALFAYDGPLGVTFAEGAPTLRLWAPTAHAVTLRLYDGPDATDATVTPMSEDPATGVWSVTGDASWKGKYYLYQVEVYQPAEGQVITDLVTDPYARSLSRNSARGQIVDLNDPALAPAGWSTFTKAPLAAPEDIVLYELHVRDFSAHDPTQPAWARGTYLAFAQPRSMGMRHLRALAQAGLTHVDLLPTFDFAGVDEDRQSWLAPAGDLASFGPGSTEQAARVHAVADADGYDWGYHPWHFFAPEGSYATEPDGAARIRQFREMVRALGREGLRVVMDVAFAYTAAAGEDETSVLDRIVPGYYQRLDADGVVTRSPIETETATEHSMMEKLMVDALVAWARDYKIDGFRVHLMGHHLKSNLLKARAALDALTLAKDGVDGRSIYVYGDGWNDGPSAWNARGVNASQLNMAGTGIGTISDRLRDAVRGENSRGVHGFISTPCLELQGSGCDPYGSARLLFNTDIVRLGMAGNLADYVLRDPLGVPRLGKDYDFYLSTAPGAAPDTFVGAGYGARPDDMVTLVDFHHDLTLYDLLGLRLPASLPMADRVRNYNLGIAAAMFSQGIVMFHAGDELMRSKSLNNDSGNSGDWFNALDFSGQTNNWGVGLPWTVPSEDADAARAALEDARLAPTPRDLRRARDHFLELLRVRRDVDLLRLRSADAIKANVTHYNTGLGQLPGLIVERIMRPAGGVSAYREALVVLNASPRAATYRVADLAGEPLQLHPVLRASSDPVVRQSTFACATGTVRVPARTAAVFVLPMRAAAGGRCPRQ